MKKLILLLILLAPVAVTQETYSLPANAARVAILDSERIAHNDGLCLSRSLAVNCTQAQLDAAGGGGTIYANSLAGRNAFLLTRKGLSVLQAILEGRDSVNKEALFRRRWETARQPEKDNYCTLRGESAGCDPFAR